MLLNAHASNAPKPRFCPHFFFADATPEERKEEVAKRKRKPKHAPIKDYGPVLLEQILNCLIIGGIAGLSAFLTAGSDAALKTGLVSGAIVFLVELRKYRNV